MNIIAVAIRRPVTVAMFTLAALVFGMVILGRLGFNLLPELSYPTLTVRTEFEGSSPTEVENLISRPMEESLGTIKGLRQVRSVSKAGRSDIYLEFYWGTDIDLASLDVREKMDQVALPLEVKSPSLLRFNPNNDPIIRLSLSENSESDSKNESTLAKLRRFADLQLSRKLETIEGVAAVKASGGLEDEIQILIDQQKIAQLNLSIETIAQKLKSQNINLGGGQIRNGQQQILVRTFNSYKSLEDFSQTIVMVKNKKIIRLNEIAEIKFAHKDPKAITRSNGEQSVELAIYKEGDANTVNVAKAIKKKLAKLQKQIPDGMSLVTLTDTSTFIEQAINELVSAAIFGGALAMLIIYFFLGDLRATLIISATIPLSVVITFNFMYASDIDINIMSLGGLALAVGMLVDNAIVVLENIASKKEQGLEPAKAAEQGASEVAGAITASTLTTIAVFIPLVFVEGIAGELFRDQALTITYSLIVSLVMALTLIPMLGSKKSAVEFNRFQRKTRSPWKGRGLFIFELFFVILPWFVFSIIKYLFKAFGFLGRLIFTPIIYSFNKVYSKLELFFHRLLKQTLKHEFITIFSAFGLLAFSLQLSQSIQRVVLPEMAQGEFKIQLQYSPGLAIQATDKKMTTLSRELLKFDGIKQVFATAGVGNKLTSNSEQEGENKAELTLLLNKGTSKAEENNLLLKLRSYLETNSNALSAEVERPQLFSFSTPISIQVSGYNLNDLKKASVQVQNILKTSDRFIDITSNMKKGYPEAQIKFNQEKLATIGISMNDASLAVVNAIRGNKATRYRLKEQQIDVLVRLQESARNELDDLSNLIINPTSNRPIPLSAIADIQKKQGPSEIMRIDQQRVVLVKSQILYGGLSEAIEDAKQLLNKITLPYSTQIQFGGQGEEMERSFNSLFLALALAVFMVYLVMASQFESLLHPFIILLSVPLALIGAIFALKITDTELSVVVFLGLIMLAGIVVNNAIVLIDKINQLRSDGMDKYQAILTASKTRLRPILMTTLTTTLGMLPLAMGLGEGAELRAPMAITVVGGLMVSTLLTLVVIPVMYQLLDRKDFTKRSIEVSSLLEDSHVVD